MKDVGYKVFYKLSAFYYTLLSPWIIPLKVASIAAMTGGVGQKLLDLVSGLTCLA